MRPLAGLWSWALAAAVTTLIVHLATVSLLPGVIMSRLLSGLARSGGYNSLQHGPRTTASARGVVRPSPDLLYSTCPYDLSKGPLLVRARVPAGTYWSVSAFDAKTNNYFVRDDRETPNGTLAFILVANDDSAAASRRSIEQIRSPTMRGLVLFRTLIDDDANLAEIDFARRQASCETYREAIH